MSSMNAKNSSGRTVSLLNDREETPSFNSDSGTRSACSSPPITPMLTRSNSSDSTALPSPLTPNFVYGPYGAPTDPYNRLPPTMDYWQPKQPYGYGADTVTDRMVRDPFGYLGPQIQIAERRGVTGVMPVGPSVAAAYKPKKNSYPCPLAAEFNCTDHFTTSGHAARHAKKHTGKKDAFCPECGKAFTRKDNMEQHRRTHQNARGKSAEAGVKKPKQQPKRPKLSPIQSTGSIPGADSAFSTSPVQSPYTHSFYGHDTPYAGLTHNYRPSYDRSSVSENRLEALATIATSNERHDIHRGNPCAV